MAGFGPREQAGLDTLIGTVGNIASLATRQGPAGNRALAQGRQGLAQARRQEEKQEFAESIRPLGQELQGPAKQAFVKSVDAGKGDRALSIFQVDTSREASAARRVPSKLNQFFRQEKSAKSRLGQTNDALSEAIATQVIQPDDLKDAEFLKERFPNLPAKDLERVSQEINAKGTEEGVKFGEIRTLDQAQRFLQELIAGPKVKPEVVDKLNELVQGKKQADKEAAARAKREQAEEIATSGRRPREVERELNKVATRKKIPKRKIPKTPQQLAQEELARRRKKK